MTYDEDFAVLDSDGDGFMNGVELTTNPVTNPGDASSYPVPEEGISPSLVFFIIALTVIVIGLGLIWGKK
jgi:hypothetical protein